MKAIRNLSWAVWLIVTFVVAWLHMWSAVSLMISAGIMLHLLSNYVDEK